MHAAQHQQTCPQPDGIAGLCIGVAMIQPALVDLRTVLQQQGGAQQREGKAQPFEHAKPGVWRCRSENQRAPFAAQAHPQQKEGEKHQRARKGKEVADARAEACGQCAGNAQPKGDPPAVLFRADDGRCRIPGAHGKEIP